MRSQGPDTRHPAQSTSPAGALTAHGRAPIQAAQSFPQGPAPACSSAPSSHRPWEPAGPAPHDPSTAGTCLCSTASWGWGEDVVFIGHWWGGRQWRWGRAALEAGLPPAPRCITQQGRLPRRLAQPSWAHFRKVGMSRTGTLRVSALTRRFRSSVSSTTSRSRRIGSSLLVGMKSLALSLQ